MNLASFSGRAVRLRRCGGTAAVRYFYRRKPGAAVRAAVRI
jgi:hypothetical protein